MSMQDGDQVQVKAQTHLYNFHRQLALSSASILPLYMLEDSRSPERQCVGVMLSIVVIQYSICVWRSPCNSMKSASSLVWSERLTGESG